MKSLLLCALACLHSALPDPRHYTLSYGDYKTTFADWKKRFEHLFSQDWQEGERFGIFSENLATIERHNWLYHTNRSGFYMGLNQFSAMSHDEYQRYNKLGKYSASRSHVPPSWLTCTNRFEPEVYVPDAVDWAREGYVTPVKDQSHCGSCWIFSATGSMEGAHYRKHKILVSFSEQQILDCCRLPGCGDCRTGGLSSTAFIYVHNIGGIDTEEAYPYQGKQTGMCRIKKQELRGRVASCVLVRPEGSETALQKACALNGPISVAIDAHLPSFQHYSGGIYDDPRCNRDPDHLDHAVLVTGYATDASHRDYWLVKNSWGTSFGLQGYVHIARNQNNTCGIADLPVYPLMV